MAQRVVLRPSRRGLCRYQFETSTMSQVVNAAVRFALCSLSSAATRAPPQITGDIALTIDSYCPAGTPPGTT